jgi:hypothetical protein
MARAFLPAPSANFFIHRGDAAEATSKTFTLQTLALMGVAQSGTQAVFSDSLSSSFQPWRI